MLWIIFAVDIRSLEADGPSVARLCRKMARRSEVQISTSSGRTAQIRLPFWFGTLAAGVVVLVLQGTIGPARIWLFSLPIFLGGGALGVTDWLPNQFRKIAVTLLSVGVISVLFVLHVQLPSNALYREFGAFPEAADIVRYASESMAANDALLTMFPASRTIAYYDRKHNGRSTILSKCGALPGDFSGRVLIVAPIGKSLEQVLAWNDSNVCGGTMRVQFGGD